MQPIQLKKDEDLDIERIHTNHKYDIQKLTEKWVKKYDQTTSQKRKHKWPVNILKYD